jgi:hypothetical protein
VLFMIMNYALHRQHKSVIDINLSYYCAIMLW